MSEEAERQPLVSVIIPTYNRPAYLEEALSSALNQEMGDIEILVSDDASPGEAAAGLCQAVADPRVRYHRNEVNLGVAGNVFRALERSRGRYFSILHDDDRWLPGFLSRLVPILEEDPEVVVAFSDHYIMDSKGVVLQGETDRSTLRWGRQGLAPGRHQPFHRLALIDQSVPAAMAAVFRRSVIDAARLPVAAGECWDLWLTYLVAASGAACYYVPDRLTAYRVHAGSVTTASGESFRRGSVYCWVEMASDERLLGLRPELTRKLGSAEAALGVLLLREGRVEEARRVLGRALAHHPDARTLGAYGATWLPSQVRAWLPATRAGCGPRPARSAK